MVAYLTHIEETSPSDTRRAVDRIIKIKDEGHLTFGLVLSKVSAILTPRIRKECEDVKRIRNTLGAHFFLVIMVDPKNKTMRAFQDVNNHRKLIRRLYSFVKMEERIYDVEYFLKIGSPLVMLRTIEHESYRIERLLLEKICDIVWEKVAKIMSEFRDKTKEEFTLDHYIEKYE